MSSSSSSANNNAILRMERMPNQGPFPTLDPFLFCVYHKDQYPQAVNDEMEAPQRGNGMDFDPTADYRMYHGTTIPGFPQHPHRGFETITATMTGLIDHADSVGNAGRYGEGDVQWMTAGAGVVHSEMFPLLKTDDENPTRFFQIWLNLPSKSKMVNPSFAMFWNTDVPRYEQGSSSVTIWAGRDYWNSAENNPPPPDSWAADPNNDVAIWHITVKDDKITLPQAHFGSDINRSLFYVEGGNQAVTLNGDPVKSRVVITVRADQEITLERTAAAAGHEPVEFLLLQGRPINEPVAQHGPFVMNTQQEIRQAFMDYSATQFGGWPWPRDDMVFPREKGRFALLQGQEIIPDDGESKTCKEKDEK